jgi:hypothetical protein
MQLKQSVIDSTMSLLSQPPADIGTPHQAAPSSLAKPLIGKNPGIAMTGLLFDSHHPHCERDIGML